MPQAKILAMLHDEHRKVTELFNDLEMTTARSLRRRQKIFSRIDEALGARTDFERRQASPLPAGRKTPQSTALEAAEEHAQFKRLLAELRELDPQDERWMTNAQVFMEGLRHHVKGKKETETFPQLRKGAGAETIQHLAQKHQVLKEQAQQQAKSRRLQAKAKKTKQTKKAKDGIGCLRHAGT